MNHQLEALPTKTGFQFLSEYFAQQLISTAGAMIGGILITAIPAVGIPFITGNLDRTDFPITRLTSEPYFAVPVVLAIALGFWQQKRFHSSAAYFLALVPGLFLLSTFLSWQSYTPKGRWEDAWLNLFTRDCYESECYYEYMFTGPFYTSVAYTIGWMLAKAKRGKALNAS